MTGVRYVPIHRPLRTRTMDSSSKLFPIEFPCSPLTFGAPSLHSSPHAMKPEFHEAQIAAGASHFKFVCRKRFPTSPKIGAPGALSRVSSTEKKSGESSGLHLFSSKHTGFNFIVNRKGTEKTRLYCEGTNCAYLCSSCMSFEA